jgi:AcrR family transcriptional regulator
MQTTDDDAPATRRRRAMRITRGDRQEQILLRGAEKLLHERPLSELTMEAVAAEAGMSRSAVYFYFGSKAAIVDTLIERLTDEMLAPFRNPPEGQGLAEYLERTMRQVFASWRQHRPVFQAAIELSTSDADSRVRWRANMKQFTETVARVAERERAQGRLDPGGDLGQCAAAAGWMVERSCYMLFSREHSAVEEQELMDTLTLMVTRGLGAR